MFLADMSDECPKRILLEYISSRLTKQTGIYIGQGSLYSILYSKRQKHFCILQKIENNKVIGNSEATDGPSSQMAPKYATEGDLRIYGSLWYL